MFCPRCGVKLVPGSHSCHACRAGIADDQSAALWRRPLTGGILGSVCAAIAQHYGWKPSRVRIVTILLILFTGIGLFAYFAAWFIIPREQYPTQFQST
jgi:phage shock protein PspC (stress-responsive transcriptional regulator)